MVGLRGRFECKFFNGCWFPGEARWIMVRNGFYRIYACFTGYDDEGLINEVAKIKDGFLECFTRYSYVCIDITFVDLQSSRRNTAQNYFTLIALIPLPHPQNTPPNPPLRIAGRTVPTHRCSKPRCGLVHERRGVDCGLCFGEALPLTGNGE